MVKHFTRELITEQARIVESPVKHHEVNRTFELPKAIYGVTVALYLGFFAIMATGLPTAGLIIPMAIFTIFVIAAFGVPAIWTQLAPTTKSKSMSRSKLRSDGIDTLTGRLPAKDAAVQVLILPVIVFCWGIAAVTIASLVR